MFREFFCARHPLFAWIGLCVLCGHALFGAWQKARLNSWFKEFYDLLGSASAEIGSGADSEAAGRVASELRYFCWIVAPSLLVHPVARYVRSRWSLAWRMKLIRHYLSLWSPDGKKLEGSSQRIQEDTARLARSVDTAVAVVMDSVATLVIFTPILIDMGNDVAPPEQLKRLGKAWLFYTALCTSALHLGGAWWIGTPLVRLEVANQAREAEFRRRLVLDEALPAGADAEDAYKHVCKDDVLTSLRRNLLDLYRNFFFLNFYLSLMDQLMVSAHGTPPLARPQRSATSRITGGSAVRVRGAPAFCSFPAPRGNGYAGAAQQLIRKGFQQPLGGGR